MSPQKTPNAATRKILEEICRLDDDATLLEGINSLIAEAIACDGVWFNSLDLRDGRHCWRGFHGGDPEDYELSDGPGEIDPSLATHRWDHPLLRICRRDAWVEASSISDYLRQLAWIATPLFNEYYREAGIRFQAGFSIARAPHHFVGITLNRTNSDFRRRELNLLRDLQPWIALAFRGAMRREWWRAEIDLLKTVPVSGNGLVLVSRKGDVEWLNDEAEVMLKPWSGTLPPEVRARFRADYIDSPALPALPAREWQICAGREPHQLLCHCILGPRPAVILQWEHSTAQLTAREREIMEWLMQGKTNAEIAVILECSVRTVEKHVERTFKKLRVTRRSDLVRQLHGITPEARGSSDRERK